MKRTITILTLIGLVAACSNEHAESAGNADSATQKKTASGLDLTSNWVGVWQGDSTDHFIRISPGLARTTYKVTLQTSQGPSQFLAKWDKDQLIFMQNGREIVIRSVDGKQTGIAEFASLTDCITVRQHGGYCRLERAW